MDEVDTTRTQRPKVISPARGLVRMLLGGSSRLIGAFMRQVHSQTSLQGDIDQVDDFVHAFPPSDTTQGFGQTQPQAGSMDTDEQELPITDLQYVLTGIALDFAARMGRVTNLAGRVLWRSSRRLDGVISPVTRSRVMQPINTRFEQLVQRGERQVDIWREMGKQESDEGAELLGAVTISSVNKSVEYLADQPEVVDLITKRGVSFGQRILTIFRRFFVTVDIVIEGVVRRIFRMTPRYQLEPPATELRLGAGRSRIDPNNVVDLESTHIGFYAGIASRMTATVIDLLFVSISLNIVLWFIRMSIEFMGVNPSMIIIYSRSSSTGDMDITQFLTVSAIGITYFVLYHAFSWVLFGQTIGYAVVGLRLVTMSGKPPRFLRSWLRVSFGYPLSIAIFGIGLWMIIYTEHRLGLHDILFRTCVLYSWDAKPSDRFLLRLEEKYGSSQDV